jgi:hypothetical protein
MYNDAIVNFNEALEYGYKGANIKCMLNWIESTSQKRKVMKRKFVDKPLN